MPRRPKIEELIPTCLGTHEAGEPLCDGNPEATGNDAKPCSWRERCMGFMQHLEDTGHDDEQYIELVPIRSRVIQDQTGWKRTAKPVGRSHPQFDKFLRGLVRSYGIRPIRRKVAARTAPKAKKSAKHRANKYSEDKQRQAIARQLIAHFCYTLREETGRKLSLTKRGASLVLPGTLYAIDRRVKSGYLAIYCRKLRRQSGKNAQDIGVATLFPRFRTNNLDIRLAVDVRDVQRVLSTEDQFKLNPTPVRDGAFKTVCKRLDQEGVAQVARALARLIEQDILSLPPR